jgi:hemoglobin-like flavoprotein
MVPADGTVCAMTETTGEHHRHEQQSAPVAHAYRRIGPLERPTPEAMAIVRATASAVADRPAALAERFYHHLFDIAPGVRSMFPKDMTAQNERLSRALFDAIRALVDSEAHAARMEQNLHRLGTDHAHRYGVQPMHYPYVGHALVRAVYDVSGDWAASTSSAWLWVYEWVSTHMIEGHH